MIRLEKIGVQLDGQRVLDRFSLTIANPGITCLMGRSGVGKTTLLRVLLGLQSSFQGSIEGLQDLLIGAVFQEDRLLPWLSALDNVTLVQRTPNAPYARALMARLGLDDESVHKKTDQLSGGMQRRVALARALVNEPDLLILDEPFTGLDDDLRLDIIAQLKEYGQRHAVLLVSHDERDALHLGATVTRME